MRAGELAVARPAPAPRSREWFRQARRARLLSWFSYVGIGVAVSSLVVMPLLGRAKHRLGAKLGSAATAGEGTQNILCAYLAAAVLVGLLGNTFFGLWWLDPLAALVVPGLAVMEGRESWCGEGCRGHC